MLLNDSRSQSLRPHFDLHHVPMHEAVSLEAVPGIFTFTVILRWSISHSCPTTLRFIPPYLSSSDMSLESYIGMSLLILSREWEKYFELNLRTAIR